MLQWRETSSGLELSGVEDLRFTFEKGHFNHLTGEMELQMGREKDQKRTGRSLVQSSKWVMESWRWMEEEVLGLLYGRWGQHRWAAVCMGWFVEEKNSTVVPRAWFWWVGWKMVSSTAAENRSWNLELGGIELCSLWVCGVCSIHVEMIIWSMRVGTVCITLSYTL